MWALYFSPFFLDGILYLIDLQGIHYFFLSHSFRFKYQVIQFLNAIVSYIYIFFSIVTVIFLLEVHYLSPSYSNSLLSGIKLCLLLGNSLTSILICDSGYLIYFLQNFLTMLLISTLYKIVEYFRQILHNPKPVLYYFLSTQTAF